MKIITGIKIFFILIIIPKFPNVKLNEIDEIKKKTNNPLMLIFDFHIFKKKLLINTLIVIKSKNKFSNDTTTPKILKASKNKGLKRNVNVLKKIDLPSRLKADPVCALLKLSVFNLEYSSRDSKLKFSIPT